MSEFIRNQIVACRNAFEGYKYQRMFMPENGICWSCHKQIVDKLIEKGNDGSEIVTGCPICSRSYVD